ncbi:MAG: thioredoxin family protein [Verrucomicrobiae bacterium]|nr:thioredoxin family protein [Verrucomicrobiae bacterium]
MKLIFSRPALLALAIFCLTPARAAILGGAFNGFSAKTQVTLVLDHDVAPAGSTVIAGVRLKMADNWHTYWRNPGEVGKPTEIDWKLPPGITAGEIRWPLPHKSFSWDLGSYEYGKEVMLLVPLTIDESLTAGAYTLAADLKWLECENDGACVPGKGSIAGTLTIGAESKASAAATEILTWQKRLPLPNKTAVVVARWDGDAVKKDRKLLLEWESGNTNTDFFAYHFGQDWVISPASEIIPTNPGRKLIRKTVTLHTGDWPTEFAGVLVTPSTDEHHPTAEEVTARFDATFEKADGTAIPQSPAMAPPTAEPTKPLAYWLLLAFLGGLILNIMPCVLPVISLKILGFVKQANEEPARIRRLGLVYSAGVLCSFLALAALVVGVQQAGRIASWGMQFQSPVFLVCMLTLIVLVALNLFGLFEVYLGGGAMTAASDLASKEGPTGAFFNGVLATALATPCTAPLLASALGFAFAQPAALIVLFFLTIGAGLALPYLVLSFQPQWLRFLPRPGNWMVSFKKLMGFPMLATAVWMFWVATRSFDGDGSLWLGLFLVTISLAAFIWGEFVQRGTKGRGLAGTIAILLVAGGYGYALESQLNWRHPAPPAATNGVIRQGQDGIEWHPWSADAIAEAQAQGRPVLVDFTADWCLTCKANKKTSIEIDSTRAKLKELNYVSLIADNTLSRPDIAAELIKHGRAGVPLVLVYPPDQSKAPKVLPTLLTPGAVHAALEQAAK